MSFLYLLTGCLDLARNPGQKKQRLPQAGKTWRDTTPETALILDIQDEQMGHQILPFLSLPNLWGFGCGEGKERPRIEMGTSQIQWPACDQQQLHLQVTNLKTIEQEYKCTWVQKLPKKRKKERIKFDERCESYLGWMPARAGTEAGNFGLCHAATGIPAYSTASLPLLGI